MLIAGAGGHAKDLLTVIENKFPELVFFDDMIQENVPTLFLGKFGLIKTLDEATIYFKKNKPFILGIGGTYSREKIYDKLKAAGGEVVSMISEHTEIGSLGVEFGFGLNIMPFAFISNNVKIGNGTLIDTKASLHHDVNVGDFCNLAPSCTLLGSVQVGHHTLIGSNSVILPGIRIGNNCIVGAGSVVTKNVPDNSTIMGVPAQKNNN